MHVWFGCAVLNPSNSGKTWFMSFAEVTLNMLNSTETPGDSLVDIEGLEESPMKKLEFGLASASEHGKISDRTFFTVTQKCLTL